MFIMTAKCDVGPYKPFSPSSLTWKRTIDNYSDSAVIRIPAICHLGKDRNYNLVDTAKQFEEGMKVQINAGYDNKNDLRFIGFIKRINYTIPLELECEGYAYILRQKLNINLSFRAGTNLKIILMVLTRGTEIKLSNQIPDVTMDSAIRFENASGIQCLDLLKEKFGLTVYFNWDVLYVGLRETEVKDEVKFSLGWNVIKDNELKLSVKKEFSQVKIVIKSRNADGTFREAVHDSKFTSTKVKQIKGRLPQWFLDKMAADEKKKLVNLGYEGMITAFLIPYAEPGMAAVIDDKRYPERKGTYFIEAVDGEFSASSGGRQKIKIGNVLSSG